ncbi:legumain-like [Rhopilema esculentum]|uniref:legumain-like n=1 Tax=Rhopilema esculentum TaxID=499914 RepID=UPI0031DAB8C9
MVRVAKDHGYTHGHTPVSVIASVNAARIELLQVSLVTAHGSRPDSLKMKTISVAFVVCLLFLHQCEVDAKIWALLVAGSNGWYNYRHQADICHAYQILHKHGVPDENIVVMMYDDLAENYENPTKGIIINQPNGPDVYKGVPKDYTGHDVTPANFLNILKGNKEAMSGIGSGKVIESGPDDYVFVNFADHGAPGLIAFPNGELHAGKLHDAILYMNETKKYKQMVFYIEACESGSMFDQTLPHNIKVFATTASDARHSSYACYWDKKRQTYLGDVYSVQWMQDSDKEDLTVETLQEQYEIVRKKTNTSHVMEFGDMTMKDEVVGLFQGGKKSNVSAGAPPKPITDAVPSPDVPLMILYKSLELAKTKVEYRQIQAKIAMEESTRSLIRVASKSIVGKLIPEETKRLEILSSPAKILDRRCYEEAVKYYKKHCFDFSKYEHALRHIYVLSNLCDHGVHIDQLKKTVKHVCQVMKIQ